MAAENNIVGEVGLKVVPVDPGFNAGVQAIINRAERSAQFKVGANTQEAERAIDNLIGKTGAVADGWARAGLEVAGFTAALFGIRAAVDGIINKFAGLFDQLTQARAGFTSILKSQTAGDNLLDEIREFARVSPFVTQQLVNYSQQLLGVGVASEKIVPLLTRVGDVISSVGGDTQNIGRVLFTLTQIQSIGRLTGQDAIQLQSALIPITKYLADFLGKTTAQIKKMQEAGSISAETVFAAISAQGEKVEGAMLLATRTIGGAKSVLSDTITVFLTSQPVLERIYQDIVAGILTLSNALGEESFQIAVTRFFDQVGRIYDALQPFVETLTSLGASGGLIALNTLGSSLQVLATVLESIPEVALQAIAAFFIAMSTIKAPLLLIKYITNIQKLTGGLLGAASAQRVLGETTEQTTTRIERQTKEQERAAFAATKTAKAITAAALAATIGGSLLSDGQGGTRDIAGGFLQLAGTGTLIGAQAGGPVGAAAGAVGGATVAAVTSIISANEKAKEAARKEGEEAAQEYVDGFIATLNRGKDPNAIDSGQLDSFIANLEVGEKASDRITQKIKEAEKNLEDVRNAPQKLGQRGTIGAEYIIELDLLNLALEKNKREQDALLADPKYGDYLDGIAAKLALINGLDPDTLTRFFPEESRNLETNTGIPQGLEKILIGGAVPRSTEDLALFNDALAELGLTLDSVFNKTPEETIDFADRFSALPAAFKEASFEAIQFGNALDLAAKNSVDFFSPFKREIDAVGTQLNDVKQTAEAFAKLYNTDKDTGKTSLRSDIGASDINTLTQQFQTTAIREQEIAYARLQKTLEPAEAAKQAQIQSTRILAGEFEVLQRTLDATDSEFKELLVDAGVYNLFSSTFDEKNNITVETLGELSNRLGITKNRLKELLELTGGNETTQIISTQDTDAALVQIGIIQAQIDSFSGKGNIHALVAEIARLQTEAAANTREVTAAINEQEAAATRLFNTFSTQAQTYLAVLEGQQSFNDTLGSLFEVTDTNTLAITSNLETIASAAATVLTDAANAYAIAIEAGATDLEANATAADRALGGFAALQSTLKLTNTDFEALLRSLGLYEEFTLASNVAGDALTGSLSSIAVQLGLTNEELFSLTGLLGSIDPNLNIVVTADTAEALERIKEITDILAASGRGGSNSPVRRALEAELATLRERAPGGVTAVSPDTRAQQAKIDADNQRKADAANKAAEAELVKWQQAVEAATSSLTDAIESAAESIVAAADRWVGSIKERTEYETAVSAARLARNADRQTQDLEELGSGLSNLRSRGVTDDVLKALGIDNVADVRQIRKLVRSSDSELSALSSSVSGLNSEAAALALSEEDKRTRANISQAIVDAAKTLGIDKPSADQAAGLAAQFNITPGLNAEEVALAILNQLSAGRIGA